MKSNIITFKPNFDNKKLIFLLLMDRKLRFWWLILLRNKTGFTVLIIIKGFFQILQITYGRYPISFYFNRGYEINTKS